MRLLRHGVRPNGKSVLSMMPARFYAGLSDEDLGAVIAYVRSVPAVDNPLPSTQPTVVGTVILGVMAAGDMPAEKIDHTAPRPTRLEPALTADYGRYLATIGGCPECHGENLAGGQVDPSAPFGPNLTPGGELGQWSEADFISAIRTGIEPEGRPISPFMPWETYRNMTDEELQAIWLYLQSLAALPTNQP